MFSTQVISEITEQAYEAGLPVEEGLTKVKAIVQELCTKIVDLETRAIPSTPPEELEVREEFTKDVIASLEDAKALCMEKYTQDAQIYNNWMEDEELNVASEKVKEVQRQMDALHASIATMPIREKMEMIKK